MQIQGTLEGFDFCEILQMLSISGRSGRLVLTQRAGQGVIVLRRGKIIYAASNAVREALGHILVCKGLITEDELMQALQLQREAAEECRLGSILVDRGIVSEEELRLVVKEQVEKVVLEILGWHDGYFRFDELDLADCGEVEIDGQEFLWTEGLSTERMLMERSLRQDLMQDERPLTEAPRFRNNGRKALPPVPSVNAPAPAPGRPIPLSTLTPQIHTPEFTGEITLAILAYAQRVMPRAVVFRTGPLGFVGMGQFGVEPPNGHGADFVRRIKLPLDQPSILTAALARKTLYRGALEESEANSALVRSLGGGWPSEVVTAPLMVSGRVLMVLYGDNLPGLEPLGPFGRFEEVLLEAAVAMERSALAKRETQLRQQQEAHVAAALEREDEPLVRRRLAASI